MMIKDRQPSASMLPSDGGCYRCDWIDSGLTIHCDGNVSCGLDDPHASRSFGNIKEASLASIYSSQEIEHIREGLWSGRRCHDCSLYAPTNKSSDTPPLRKPLPTTLVIEPTVLCNIKCVNPTCDINNDRNVSVREESRMSLETFRSLIDQSGPDLERVFFFNYGESFVNRHAGDMLLYLRESCPDVRIVSSTNGIPLANAKNALSVVRSKLDELTFTISGVTQSSYERYHVGGDLDKALRGMRNVCDMRSGQGSLSPHVEWRYLLFNWNDSECEISAAITIARLCGVDRLTLYLTDIPRDALSYRLAPGTRLHEKFAPYISFVHSFAADTPDVDGLWGAEVQPDQNLVRWTSWRSRLHLERDGLWLRMTIRGRGIARESVLLITSWGIYRLSLLSNGWTRVALLVPIEFHAAAEHIVEIVATDCWFPCDEFDSEDRRCLGVMVGPIPEANETLDAASWHSLLTAATVSDDDRQLVSALPPLSVCVPEEPYLDRFRANSEQLKARYARLVSERSNPALGNGFAHDDSLTGSLLVAARGAR